MLDEAVSPAVVPRSGFLSFHSSARRLKSPTRKIPEPHAGSRNRLSRSEVSPSKATSKTNSARNLGV